MACWGVSLGKHPSLSLGRGVLIAQPGADLRPRLKDQLPEDVADVGNCCVFGDGHKVHNGDGTKGCTNLQSMAVVRLYQEVMTGKNLDLADELLTPSFVYHPSQPGKTGPESLRRLLRFILSMFSDWQYEFHSVVAEGDEVAVRATGHSTHVGTFMDIEPTGKRASGREMAFFRFEEGKIAEI